MKKALLALLLAPTVANAGYVGGAIGQSSVDFENMPDYGEVSVDDSSTSVNLFIGNYVNDVFGIEAGYESHGDFSAGVFYNYPELNGYETLDISGFSLYVAGKARFRVSPAAAITAHAGINRWSVDIDHTGEFTDLTGSYIIDGHGSDSGFSPVLGLGFEYQATPILSVVANARRYVDAGEDVTVTYSTGYRDTSEGGNVDIFNVGVSAKF